MRHSNTFMLVITLLMLSCGSDHQTRDTPNIQTHIKTDTQTVLNMEKRCEINILLGLERAGETKRFTVTTDTISGKNPCVQYILTDGMDTLIFGLCSPDLGKENDSPHITDIFVKAKGKKRSLKTGKKQTPVFIDYDGFEFSEGVEYCPIIKVENDRQNILVCHLLPYGCVGTFCNDEYILIVDFSDQVTFLVERHDLFFPVVTFDNMSVMQKNSFDPAFLYTQSSYFSMQDSAVFDIRMKSYQGGNLIETPFSSFDKVNCTYNFSTNIAALKLIKGDKIETITCSF